MQAAEELAVRSPLKEAKITKNDIRELSRELGLPTWNKPSFACLSSCFPYGFHSEKDERMRVYLCNTGFTGLPYG